MPNCKFFVNLIKKSFTKRLWKNRKIFRHILKGARLYITLEIEPIIYTYATEEQKAILREQFGVMPFLIKTIRLERIFVDKIFAAEFYYEREMYFDVAKHIYDVGVMFDMQPIRDMFGDSGLFFENVKAG